VVRGSKVLEEAVSLAKAAFVTGITGQERLRNAVVLIGDSLIGDYRIEKMALIANKRELADPR